MASLGDLAYGTTGALCRPMSDLRTRPKTSAPELGLHTSPVPMRPAISKVPAPDAIAHGDRVERASTDRLDAVLPQARFEVMHDAELGDVSERPEDLAMKAFSMLQHEGLESSSLILARVRDRASQMRSLCESNPHASFAPSGLERAARWDRIVDSLESTLEAYLEQRTELEHKLTPELLRSIEDSLSKSDVLARQALAKSGPEAARAKDVVSNIEHLRGLLEEEPSLAWRLEGAVASLASREAPDPLTIALLRDIPRSLETKERDKKRIFDVLSAAAAGFSMIAPVGLASALLFTAPDAAAFASLVSEARFRGAASETEMDTSAPDLTRETVSGWDLALAGVSVAGGVLGVRAALARKAAKPAAAAALAPRSLPDWWKPLLVEGRVVNPLIEAAQVPAFVRLAETHPEEAAAIVKFFAERPQMAEVVSIASVLDDVAATGPNALRELGVQLAAPQVTSEIATKGYEIARRLPTVTNRWTPAVHIRPPRNLDGTGAFAAQGQLLDEAGRLRSSPTAVPTLGNVRPEQLIVNGRPLETMKEVAVFSAHGSRFGFHGLTNEKAAELIAEGIRKARAEGQTVSAVVLDSCHQRDLRWFVGGSNAEALASRLNAKLDSPVQVLAANRPGPLYGNNTKLRWLGSPRGGRDVIPAIYEAAENGAKFHVTPKEVAAMLGAAAVGAAGTAAVSYGVVTIRSEPEQAKGR